MNPPPEPVVSFTPIEIIHSLFPEPTGMPIPPAGAVGIRSTVQIGEKFRDGLRDLCGFSRIILIYHLSRSLGYVLDVIPFIDTVPFGVFSLRAPHRLNAIGLSIVRLISANNCERVIEDADVVDGTPLLDIKLYVLEFDCFPDEKSGWFFGCREKVVSMRADQRFCEKRG